MNYKPLIMFLKSKYGGHLNKRPGRVGSDGCKRKTLWTWRIGAAEDITRFLTDITPFLQQKRKEAKLMLRYIKTGQNPEKTAKEFHRLKKLNNYPK